MQETGTYSYLFTCLVLSKTLSMEVFENKSELCLEGNDQMFMNSLETMSSPCEIWLLCVRFSLQSMIYASSLYSRIVLWRNVSQIFEFEEILQKA